MKNKPDDDTNSSSQLSQLGPGKNRYITEDLCHKLGLWSLNNTFTRQGEGEFYIKLQVVLQEMQASVFFRIPQAYESPKLLY